MVAVLHRGEEGNLHRLSATPGGWNAETAGVILIEQTPAPLVFLTAADTEIQTLAIARRQLPQGFPALRVANLLNLQQQLAIDTYAEALHQAKVIVLRLLGGRAYWSYGLEVVRQVAEQRGAALFVLPGDDRPDPDLMTHSTRPLSEVNQLWQYLTEGGVENTVNALHWLAHTCLGLESAILPPQPIPRVGLYQRPAKQQTGARAGILFYRAHYLSGNLAAIEALCVALEARGLKPVPVYVSSLRDADVQADVIALFQPKTAEPVQIVLNATSFSVARLESETLNLDLWQQLDVPVLQVILSSSPVEEWRSHPRGLAPRDVAMNVALPEVDGRIIGRAVSFKTVQTWDEQLETDVVRYEPLDDRVQWTADLAVHWVRLRQTPVGDRRIALILANYPTRDGRLANGVGLDTPASCVEILKALQQAGYKVDAMPATGAELIHRLTQGVTNDPESHALRQVNQSLSWPEYQTYFATLPDAVQQGIRQRWGDPQIAAAADHEMAIAGLQLGNLFVGIQPARGYEQDPSLNYHAPDLEPPHAYLAFYYWLRQRFACHAIVHVGKHGNLEWLPGKSMALSQDCYPEVAIGPLPHLYPFIVNDPGEGSQAKRRTQAVIIDHLTPPMTRAELYGGLQQLEGLIDEYYEAQNLNPSRLPALRDRIRHLITQEHLNLALPPADQPASNLPFEVALNSLDGYLCELKEAQIRDGLHILGQCPQGRQLRDLIVAIARAPQPGRRGLTQAIAQQWGLDFDPLTAAPSEKLSSPHLIPQLAGHHPTLGDAIAALEQEAATLVEQLLTHPHLRSLPCPELDWIRDRLLPALQQTDQEITQLLRGLSGHYVPSGAAGAPTRGRPEVLPTGRNFYSVDIRALPTETAWEVGRKAAELIVERYTQENGEYPKTLALSLWGTATMRTGGDDLAEALALLGVRPVWDGMARRVVDFEILPVSALGRPRVDVTLRISGFFRDAFPNLIDLYQQAVAAVAELDEAETDNPLAARVRHESITWQQQGVLPEIARQRSLYRVFGSKPGAYGAGLQGLIESQQWTTDQDLAQAYINWSSYAYTGQADGRAAPEAFAQRLQQLQIVLHNQDNREHDLLDSDDYYQFQGGLTAAVRSLTGKNPQTYFGDHALPAHPRIRSLQEEIAKVYRSRVINPKWLAGVMRHGYKGAFEMAATVDYLFAYDATAHCVEDYMYQGMAQSYLFDAQVHTFVQTHNPWALRDMAERLLEAHQRQLWLTADAQTLEQLRAIALQAEAIIETRSGNP